MPVSTFEKVSPTPAPVLTNSKVTIGLNDPVTYDGTTIKAWAVTEDSRCPTGVVCIQAGRVVVALDISSASGSTKSEISVGKTIATDKLSITLDAVAPNKLSTHKITDAEYRFTFTIKSI